MAWQAETVVHIGGRKEQQDRTLILPRRFGTEFLLVLGDGMGGHAQGAAAAQALVDTVEQHFPPNHGQHATDFLKALCTFSHQAIQNLNQKGASGAPPGSTCVFLHLKAREAHWLHVGDSRLYHYRGNRLIFRTEDHTLAALKASRAKTDAPLPTTDRRDNRLYKCLGGNNQPEPSLGASILTEEDWFLLCSDGFWHAVEPQEAAVMVHCSDSLALAARRLVELAVYRGEGKGDNVSLILARYTRAHPRLLPPRLRKWFG